MSRNDLNSVYLVGIVNSIDKHEDGFEFDVVNERHDGTKTLFKSIFSTAPFMIGEKVGINGYLISFGGVVMIKVQSLQRLGQAS